MNIKKSHNSAPKNDFDTELPFIMDNVGGLKNYK